MRKINTDCLNLIKQFEGLSLKAYPDPATGGDPWTIGYGHTGPEVKPELTITQVQADAYLVQDLEKFSSGVQALVTGLNHNQFGACVSLAYNIGLGNFKSSTLLKHLLSGDHQLVPEQFLRWNKAAGKVMAGLTRRREAEKTLFLKAVV